MIVRSYKADATTRAPVPKEHDTHSMPLHVAQRILSGERAGNTVLGLYIDKRRFQIELTEKELEDFKKQISECVEPARSATTRPAPCAPSPKGVPSRERGEQ